MQIIIVGCGKIGFAIVEQLSSEEHDIVVVDRDPAAVKKVTDNCDVMGIVGDGSSYNTLLEAGIEKADLLCAVMDSDETNLLCCVIAKKTGNCSTVARVRNPVYLDETDFFMKELDIAIILNPDYTAACEIERVLRFPYATNIDVFANGRVQLVSTRVTDDSALVGMKLRDMKPKFKSNILLSLIRRGDEVFIPDGDSVIEENDIISVAGTPGEVDSFLKKCDPERKRVTDTMIVGGGRIGYYLGKKLLDAGIRVRIIERDAARCEKLCELLPEADIICGDGTDKTMLTEEGIDAVNGFAALTNIDEENIMLSLFARERDVIKTVTKVNRFNFNEVISKLDLDTIIYPNRIMTDIIIRNVRSMADTMGNNIETLRKLADGKAEALGFVVREGAKVIGIPLGQMRRKHNTIVCCISRGNQVIIPGGQDEIKAGDRVVVVETNGRLYDIDDIIDA